MRFLHARVWCGLAVAARVLTACGGGGGSGTLPASGSSVGPSPAITATTMPTATATATSTPGIVSGAGFAKIRHVVVIVQENRTPDNLFHGLPGADIASTGITSSGQTVTLQPIPLNAPYDLDHSHNGFVKMYDGGKMDGADRVGTGCGPSCPYSNPQFGYVPPASVQPYFSLATQYVFADRMFQTNQGPSYPAHQYLFGGTSLALPTSVNLVSENPHPPGGGNDTGNNDSCAGIAGSYVQTLAADGSTSNVFPCFERQTIADLLDAKNVSWRYYAPNPGGIWTAPNSIRHLRYGPDWSNVVIPETTVLSDIAANRLANVSWVIPSGQASDHALSNDGSGPAWVASVVNAIGTSPYWNDTAILITWDDWGGWYDHVAPPAIYNQYELGFRVPLIVVSPYAKSGYVSHVLHEFGSTLKFLESVYGLGSLNYTDVRSDDLADCFDFTQAPRAYHPLAVDRSPESFLHRVVAPSDPDDD